MSRLFYPIYLYLWKIVSHGCRAVRLPVLAGILLCIGSTDAFGQVSIAPTALFLNDQTRSASLYVSNGTNQTQQVEVGFQFGYPAADSAGNVYMEYEDSTAAEQYSLKPYLRVFPRQFSLPGGESQVVRVVTRPLSEKENGVYWTRLITTSEPQVEDIDTSATGVQTNITFRIRQVTSILYQKGNVGTEIALGDVTAAGDSNVVAITAELNRSGNAPFLGMAHMTVRRGGEVVMEVDRAIAAYFSMCRRFMLEHTGELSTGTYTAEMRLTSERNDIPAQHRIPITPTSKTVQFQVE